MLVRKLHAGHVEMLGILAEIVTYIMGKNASVATNSAINSNPAVFSSLKSTEDSIVTISHNKKTRKKLFAEKKMI